MARPSAEALQSLLPILRQLREIKGVKESQPGSFVARRDPFVQVHEGEGGTLHAELKKPGGAGFDRFPLGSPAEQRKFVDEAKLRARRLDDD